MKFNRSWREISITTDSHSIACAARIIRTFDIEPQPADRLVQAFLRCHRELHSRERRRVADLVFGVMRWRRRLEGCLELEGIKKHTPEQLVRTFIRWPEVTEKHFPGGLAAYHSFPDHLYHTLVRQEGSPGAVAMMESFNESAPTTIRVNTCKGTREELSSRLEDEGIATTPTRRSPYGLIVDRRMNFDSLASFKEGWFEVQDEGSQLAAMAVKAKSGETIMDACAGAGGKTLLMAMEMNDVGTIIAFDTDGSKLRELSARAKRAGASIIRVIKPSKNDLLLAYRATFDAVLVDAPCSGTGTLRRNPDLKWRLTESQLQQYPKTQLELLRNYAGWVKPDGRLIYVTCSILASENEDVVKTFTEQTDFECIEQCIMKPGENGMDGFFVCDLRRVD